MLGAACCACSASAQICASMYSAAAPPPALAPAAGFRCPSRLRLIISPAMLSTYNSVLLCKLHRGEGGGGWHTQGIIQAGAWGILESKSARGGVTVQNTIVLIHQGKIVGGRLQRCSPSLNSRALDGWPPNLRVYSLRFLAIWPVPCGGCLPGEAG